MIKKLKKLYRKRIQRTPEQIAITCKSSQEAFKLGKDIHRAYIQLSLQQMTSEQKDNFIKNFKKTQELKNEKNKPGNTQKRISTPKN